MHQDYFTLTANVGNQALWDKALEGFRTISGSGWETRANYQHFPTLVGTLYKMAHGPKAELPDDLKLPLMLMFAGHIGRTRKGIRKRPYFHHILMVVYLTWVLKLNKAIQRAAIHHDDIEDVPKNWGIPAQMVEDAIRFAAGEDTATSVLHLSNQPHAGGKHAGQLEKMVILPIQDAILKLLDRTANLYDMRQDKPKDFGPERILEECRNALELAAAMPVKAPHDVRAILYFSIQMLLEENNLELEPALG